MDKLSLGKLNDETKSFQNKMNIYFKVEGLTKKQIAEQINKMIEKEERSFL